MFNEKRHFQIEVFNEASLYLLLLVMPIFYLRIPGLFKEQLEFRNEMGWLLIYLLASNFLGNIVTAFAIIGMDLVDSVKSAYEER